MSRVFQKVLLEEDGNYALEVMQSFKNVDARILTIILFQISYAKNFNLDFKEDKTI